jgi:anti-anti-sigma regulatory factor
MIDSFKHTLQSALDAGGEWIVDASHVEKVDSTGYQLLLAFKADLAKIGGNMVISQPSAIFIDTALMLGLSEHLIASE